VRYWVRVVVMVMVLVNCGCRDRVEGEVRQGEIEAGVAWKGNSTRWDGMK
jgi:hypothetical protein